MQLLRVVLLRAGVPIVIMGVMGVALLLEGDAVTARSTFAAGVIVAAVCGASVIYSVDRWTLLVQSAIHFAIMVCTALPAMLLSGWFELGRPLAYLAVIGIFLTGGVVMWLTFYVVFSAIQARRSRSTDGSEPGGR